MKKQVVLLLVACAFIFSAKSALAQGTCADWAGDWTFAYADGCDNVTITHVCDNEDKSNPDCLPVKDGSQQTYWICIVHGKRLSDNQTIQLRRISFDAANYGYYEAEDAAIGQETPYDKIPAASFTGTAFSAQANNLNSGLCAGTKGLGQACEECPSCTLTISPIRKLSFLFMPLPIRVIKIEANGDGTFSSGDTIDWGTDAITTLRITLKGDSEARVLAIVRPLQLDKGSYDVTFGTCVGTLTVK